MPSNTNQITQIYELRSLGFKQLSGELDSINKALADIASSKQAAAKGGSSVIDPADLAKIRAMLDEVKTKANETRQSTGGVASAFNDLKKQFDDATQKAKDLAVQFGVNSEEARVAAVSAAAYKQELLEINNLLKNPPKASEPLVSTDNLTALEAENELLQQTGTVVNELEAAQAQAANEATAWGAANQAAAGQVAATAEAVEAVITPLQEHTGTLAANIKQQAAYQTRLAEISAELRTNASTTDAAGKKTSEYRNKQAALLQEQKQLKVASAELNQTINAQQKYLLAAEGSTNQLSQKLTLLRVVYKSLNDEEKASPFGKQLAYDIQGLNTQLKNAGGAVTNYASKAFGYLRQLAYIIPGIGLGGLINLAFEGIQKLFEQFDLFPTKIHPLLEAYKALNEVSVEANKEIGKQQTQLDILFQSAQNSAIPLNERLRAVEALQKQFPEYFGNLSAEQILNGKVGDSYKRLSKDIEDSARARAALAKREAVEALKLDAEIQIEKINNARNAQLKRATATTSQIGAGGEVRSVGRSLDQVQAGINAEADKGLKIENQKIESYNAQIALLDKFGNKAKEAGVLEDQILGKQKVGLEELKKQLAEIEQKISVTSKNSLVYGQYEAERDRLKKEIAEIKGTDNSDKKAAAAADRAHKKELADEKKHQKELEKERKDAFDREVVEAEYRKDQLVKAAQRTNQAIQESVTTTPTDKDNAVEAMNQAILNAQNQFLEEYDFLEKQYNQNTAANEKTRLNILEKAQDDEEQVRKAKKNRALVDLQEIKETGDRQRLQYDIVFAEQRLKILQNDQLTASQRDAQLKKLDAAHNRVILASELATANELVKKDKALLDAGLISVDQYNAAVKAALDKANQLAQSSTGKTLDQFKTGIRGFVDSLGSIFKKGGLTQDFFNKEFGGEGSGISTGEIIVQSYDLAQGAMNEFFDAQAARIEDSKQRNLDLLAQQEDIALKTAQARGASEAEQLKIQQQYQAKKDQITKQAGEKLKKQKRAEVEIAYFSELANIAAQAAANPANAVTFGAAGIAQVTALGAFATGKLILQLAGINRQQFAYGTIFGNDDFPYKGGRIKGKSHSQGGTPFYGEAERGEIHTIIRTRNAPANGQYTITGGLTAIAGALNQIGGGPNFAPGARVQKYALGGVPGSQLQPPIFYPTSTGSSALDQQMLAQLYAQNALLAGNIQALQNTVLTLQVQQVTSTVKDALHKSVAQSQVATIGKRIG